MICSDIWHKYHEWYFKVVLQNLINQFGSILKYHEWYLDQISRTIHAITIVQPRFGKRSIILKLVMAGELNMIRNLIQKIKDPFPWSGQKFSIDAGFRGISAV